MFYPPPLLSKSFETNVKMNLLDLVFQFWSIINIQNTIMYSLKLNIIYIFLEILTKEHFMSMKQHALKSVNICWNINIYSYLETSGGQSCNLYLNLVQFFNSSVNKTSVAA